MGEDEKDNNINEEINDPENEGDLGSESDRVEEDLLGPVDNSVEDNDLADLAVADADDGVDPEGIGENREEDLLGAADNDLAEVDGSDPEDITENKDEDIVANEEFPVEASDTDIGDDTSEYAIEETPTDGLADDNLDSVDDLGLNEKPKFAFKFIALISTLKGVKGKVFAIKGRDLIKVFSNPWVIANGVVLVVALSMTVVIVSWFKARTVKINDALTNLAQLQSATLENRVSEKPVKVTVQPFIVDLEAITEEGLRTVGNKKKHGDGDFASLLESAEQSFKKMKYQEALAFYKALISNDSELKDKSFLDLRISECYFYSGLYNEAIETIKAGLDAKVSNRENRFRLNYLLAESYIKLHDYNKGRSTLYALMALEGEFTPGLKGLVERAYFAIADSYLEEARLGMTIDN